MTLAAARRTRLSLILALSIAGPTRASEVLTDFHPLWIWSETSLRFDSRALSVADLHGDGVAEILLAASPQCCGSSDPAGHWNALELRGGEFRQIWSSLGSEAEPRGVIHVPGPQPRVLVWTNLAAEVFDATTFSHLRSIPLESDEIVALIVADVDGLQGRELVACDASDLFVHDFETGEALAVRHGFGGSRLEVGQMDADPALEVVLTGNPLGGYVLDGATWLVDWGLLTGFGTGAWLVDLDGDSLDEVVVNGYSALEAIDPRTNVVLWTRPGSHLGGGTIGLLASGTVAVTGYSYSESALRAISAVDGADLWSIPLATTGNAEVAIGNLDSDPAPEVLLARSEDPVLIAVDSSTLDVEAALYSIRGPYHDLSVGDVDADGANELVTTGFRLVDGWPHWDPMVFGLATRTLEMPLDPSASIEGEAVRSLVVQIDDDPAREICVASFTTFQGQLSCYDPLDGKFDGQFTLPPGQRPLALASGDLDGDQHADVLVATNADVVHAFGGSPFGPLWTSAAHGGGNNRSTLRVGQISGDPLPEVVLAGVGAERDEVVVIEGVTGQLLAGPFAVGASAQEIVYSTSGSTGTVIIGTFDGDLAALDLTTGELQPPLASYDETIGSIRVGDLDRDGVPDLVVGVADHVTVRSGADGTPLWTSPFLYRGGADWDSIYVDDFDDNTVPEIMVGFEVGFAIFEAPLTVIFADGFESGGTGEWELTTP